MKQSPWLLSLAIFAFPIGIAGAQVPVPFSDVQPAAALDGNARSLVQAKAGVYPLIGFLIGGDSAILVFEDRSLTAAAVNAGKWMFGPPVTAAEGDSCPPEKVLGRKIARVLFRALGQPQSLNHVIIAVRGVDGIERWTAEGMHYWRDQLIGKWAGDPDST